MRFASKMTIIALALLLLASPLFAACGDDNETQAPMETPTHAATKTPTLTQEPAKDVTITIGNISDLTGPASQAVSIVDDAFKDLITYFNEEKLIPGVKLELITYDGQYDPAKDIPGYRWLREKGADLIVGSLPNTPVSLKPILDKDKVVMFAMNSIDEGLYPAGYVFSLNAPTDAYTQTMLKWIAQNDWDWQTKGPAKVGGAGWTGVYADSLLQGMQKYAEAHPDQYKWVGGYLTQFGVTWGPEVDALRGCDYVLPPPTGMGMTTFMKEYRDAGGKGRFIASDAHPAYLGLAIEALGWKGMDGWLFALSTPWWSDDAEIVGLAYELVDRYHESAEAIMQAGNSYLTPFVFWHGALLAIAETVKHVGPANFSSEALYETLMTFKVNYESPQTWGFNQTKRTNWGHVGIYVADATRQDLVRLDPEWQPIVYVP